MTARTRYYTPADRLIQRVDVFLKSTLTHPRIHERASPAAGKSETALTDAEQKHAAGLMRINHTGEVCAQALYHGQALTAHDPATRMALQQAANEEVDHLKWCETRLDELESHTSYLNPLWYGLSFLLGSTAGIAGDTWSLGFVAETERQVCQHLDSHLQKLPKTDHKSRQIVKQMRIDEAKHADLARQIGGKPLPLSIRAGMRVMAKIMTSLTYRF